MSIFGRRHSGLTGNDVGSVVWKEVADSAARLALALVSRDDGRIVKQTDNGSHWVLDDYAVPTWRELTSVGVAAVTTVFTRDGDVTATAGDYTASEVTNVPAGDIVATTVQAAL